MLQKILIILVSAFIGYITNFLAVKMIFHPKKAWKIKRFKIPFTPGIIPKNREKLTKSIADNLIDNFLNPSSLFENLKLDLIQNKLDIELVKKFDENNVKSKIVDEILNSIKPNLGFFSGVVENFRNPIENKIEDYFHANSSLLVNNIVDEKTMSLLLESIDLKEILINGLNQLSIDEFEKIILTVMKKELRAITNLGALLGAILGLINVLIA